MLGIRRNSLSYKTAILYIVLTVITVSIFNFVIWENQSDLITRSQQLSTEIQSVKLKSLLLRNRDSFRPDSAPAFYRRIAEGALSDGAKGVRVYGEGGGLLFGGIEGGAGDSSAEGKREKSLVARAVAKYELEGQEFLHDVRLDRGGIGLFIPQLLPGRAEPVVFRFQLAVGDLEKDKNALLRLCLFVALVVVALQILFGWFLRKIVILPIAKLEKATHAVSQGDFNQSIEVRQDDEIGLLASSFNEMMMSLIRIREEAKGANPLSGLPGNNVIIRKIDDMIARQLEFAVIYGDLDNFKAYNDKYGFSKGDDAILYTRDCFLAAAKKAGDDTTFVGHEGGDDFVMVTSFASWEALCKCMCSTFDAGVKQFYSEGDAKQGFIESLDRQGKRVRFPLMSISLAVASNHHRPITDHRMVVQIAAEMKKFVKKKEGGSSYAIDKRTN